MHERQRTFHDKNKQINLQAHKLCHWWTGTWKITSSGPVSSGWSTDTETLSPCHHDTCGSNGNFVDGIQAKSENQLYCSARQNDKVQPVDWWGERREKFWTVVWDTIYYIYCLKLVWTYLEAGGKQHLWKPLLAFCIYGKRNLLVTWVHAYPISSLADGSNGSENIHCRDGDASQCPIHAAEPHALGGGWGERGCSCRDMCVRRWVRWEGVMNATRDQLTSLLSLTCQWRPHTWFRGKHHSKVLFL